MTSVANTPAKQSGVLNTIERIGNALPDPVLIFIWLSLLLVGVSWFAARASFSAIRRRAC